MSRSAIVTGGGSGIGEGIAKRLACDGASVLVADINAEAAARVAEEIAAAGGTAAPWRMDVTDEASVDAAVAEAGRRFGRLRIAVTSVTEGQARLAREAYRRFGKGFHPARLNLGDCFAYVLSKATGEPLLFKGDDFPATDVARC